nr:Chain B, Drosocin [Drosophila melanogaster]
SHPRPIRV